MIVVEDDALVRQVIVTTLERAGYAVVTAANGDAASALVDEADDYVALCIDGVMPESCRDGRLARSSRVFWPAIQAGRCCCARATCPAS